MKFSVVIPLYNKEHTIAKTVLSVLNQTYTDFELIIVDDGSQDNSLFIIKSMFDDNRIKIICKPNGGVSSARNMGIKRATGDYICFLDADDEWLPNYLSMVNKATDENVDCCLINVAGQHRDLLNGWGNYYVVNKYKDLITRINIFDSPYTLCAQTSGVVIKKTLLNEFVKITNRNPFPENMTYAEDITLYHSLALIAPQVYIGKPLSIRNMNIDGQLVSSVDKMKIIDNEIKYLNYLIGAYSLLKKDYDSFKKYFSYAVRTRVSICLQEGVFEQMSSCFNELTLSHLHKWEKQIYKSPQAPLLIKILLTKLLRIPFCFHSRRFSY